MLNQTGLRYNYPQGHSLQFLNGVQGIFDSGTAHGQLFNVLLHCSGSKPNKTLVVTFLEHYERNTHVFCFENNSLVFYRDVNRDRTDNPTIRIGLRAINAMHLFLRQWVTDLNSKSPVLSLVGLSNGIEEMVAEIASHDSLSDLKDRLKDEANRAGSSTV
jgi:hypothetical protein